MNDWSFSGWALRLAAIVHGQGAAGAVVHGAVVDAIAVDGRADADVIDVRGEHDEFVLEGGIGAGELATMLEDSRDLVRMTALALRKRPMRSAGEACGLCRGSDLGEGVAGTAEEFFRGGGIAGNA